MAIFRKSAGFERNVPLLLIVATVQNFEAIPILLYSIFSLGQTKLISWFTDPVGLLYIECNQKKLLKFGCDILVGVILKLNEWAW